MKLGDNVTEEIRWLTRGLSKVVQKYGVYNINEVVFHTKDRDALKKTQNNGVSVTAQTTSYVSFRDRNPVVGEVTYYGLLKHIIELNYYDHFKIVLFQCDSANPTEGIGRKTDKFNFTLANFNRLVQTG